MASATRNLLIVMVLVAFPVYFIFIASEGLLLQVAGAVVLLLLISLLLFTGRQPLLVDSPNDPESSVDLLGSVELPPPVLSEEGASERREGKIKRSRGRQAETLEPLPTLPDPMPMADMAVSIEQEETQPGDNASGLAKVYIATSDPESQMEAQVDSYLARKRIRKNEIRANLIRDRRIESARRSALEASKWTELEDGEDISSLLRDPEHGLTVLTEPEDPDPRIPQGISYVRVDDKRVVRVRLSLDVQTSEVADPELTEEPAYELPVPSPASSIPPPLESGMPPPPPPLGNPDLPPPVRPDE